MSWIISEMMFNEPNEIDYVFVYWILGLWYSELYNIKVIVKQDMDKAHHDNYLLRKMYSDSDLKRLGIEPIDIPYERVRSPKIDVLIDKSFERFDRKVQSQILNMINTKDFTGLLTFLKSKGIVDSLVSDIMRIYRTENTLMRSNTMLAIQVELRKKGIKVKRRWVHTLSNPNESVSSGYTPREDHLALNGVVENHNGYFTTPEGKVTKAPGMFGLPEEDINCRCDVDFVLD